MDSPVTSFTSKKKYEAAFSNTKVLVLYQMSRIEHLNLKLLVSVMLLGNGILKKGKETFRSLVIKDYHKMDKTWDTCIDNKLNYFKTLMMPLSDQYNKYEEKEMIKI